MAGIDGTQIRGGLTGNLYIADALTAGPTDTGTAWPVAWIDLGLLSEDGPGMAPQNSSKENMSWQSYFATRVFMSKRGLQWTFTLQQTTGTILKLAFGGGTITDLGGGDFEYEPPDPSIVDEHAFGLEVRDGDFIDRYILDRGMATNLGAIPMKKDVAREYPITVTALDANDGIPWRLISNDASMAL